MTLSRISAEELHLRFVTVMVPDAGGRSSVNAAVFFEWPAFLLVGSGVVGLAQGLRCLVVVEIALS